MTCQTPRDALPGLGTGSLLRKYPTLCDYFQCFNQRRPSPARVNGLQRVHTASITGTVRLLSGGGLLQLESALPARIFLAKKLFITAIFQLAVIAAVIECCAKWPATPNGRDRSIFSSITARFIISSSRLQSHRSCPLSSLESRGVQCMATLQLPELRVVLFSRVALLQDA